VNACRLLCDGAQSGPWNMAVDQLLLDRAAREDLCFWRFYRLEKPTLSLGYFQALADRVRHPASLACPVVRRPSGGGAIVHDLELTYAIAVPPALGGARRHKELYGLIHQTLIHVLADWGIRASLYESKEAAIHGEEPFLCFQRRTAGDVVVGQYKVAGSAQRRSAAALLQHGSVLLGRSPAAPELPGLDQWARCPMDAHTVAEAWLAILRRTLHLEFEPYHLSRGDELLARRWAEQKYASPVWTARR